MVEEPMNPRIVLHLDMDSFYASVEMQAHPELRNKPVVIGADPKQGRGRGVVLTCSYEARAFGIRSAMPVSQAYVLCPQAVYLPPDFAHYSQVSSDVMTILKSFGFRFQQVSIDEAFLDISPLGSFRDAISHAEQIQTTIKIKTGMTCSIGIAQSKLVAKIASDFKKPAGLTVIEPAGTQHFLASLPVRKMPGIGKKAELALFERGIRTIGDLAAYDIRKLSAEFGRGAIALHETALGIDGSEVEDRPIIKSISREITFETDTDNPEHITMTMDALIEDVYSGLVYEDMSFRTLTIKVRYQGFITRTRSRTLSHYTSKKEILQSCARSLLREMIESQKVRLLGIRLSSFDKPDARQMSLEM
jgi:DNA polymerase IV (archaeal DinB-like DNA polymerase)